MNDALSVIGWILLYGLLLLRTAPIDCSIFLRSSNFAERVLELISALCTIDKGFGNVPNFHRNSQPAVLLPYSDS